MLAFLDDMCEIGADHTVTCEELWTAVTRWRESNGHRRMSNAAFGEFMRQRGFVQTRPRVDGVRLPRSWIGVRLAPAAGPARLSVVPDPSRPIGTKK